MIKCLLPILILIGVGNGSRANEEIRGSLSNYFASYDIFCDLDSIATQNPTFGGATEVVTTLVGGRTFLSFKQRLDADTRVVMLDPTTILAIRTTTPALRIDFSGEKEGKMLDACRFLDPAELPENCTKFEASLYQQFLHAQRMALGQYPSKANIYLQLAKGASFKSCTVFREVKLNFGTYLAFKQSSERAQNFNWIVNCDKILMCELLVPLKVQNKDQKQ